MKTLCADKKTNEQSSLDCSILAPDEMPAQQRLERLWLDRQSNIPSMIDFNIKTCSDKASVHITKPKEYPVEHALIPKAAFSAMTGASGDNYATHLITLLIGATATTLDDKQLTDKANAHKEALLALRPNDEIEGQLITRMIALHDQYMNCLSKACSPRQTLKGGQIYTNLATKLMRIYNETLNTLNQYRRKATHKMIVQHQHINVAQGGKAAVGNFHPGGGDV